MAVRRVTFINIECDGCGDTYDRSDFGSVAEAKAEARVGGWHFGRTRVAQLPYAACPTCQGIRRAGPEG
jgi:hypothetical protein